LDGAAEQHQRRLQQLVVRSRRGDAAAFAELVDVYERVALSIAYSAGGGDAGSASDVVQDAFLRAWQRIADLQDSAKFAPWLCGIVRNLAIDGARSRAVRSARAVHDVGGDGESGRGFGAMTLASGAPDDDPLEALGRREDRQRVVAAIATLDEVSRSAVVLRYYENLSSRQIGELLGIAPTAVDMRLMRARRQLRDHLESREQRGVRLARCGLQA
jgi:RNA polymerase sigma factor (sigma-70 family)